MNTVSKSERDRMVAFALDLVQLDGETLPTNNAAVVAALTRKFKIPVRRARHYAATAEMKKRGEIIMRGPGRPVREGYSVNLPIRVDDVAEYQEILDIEIAERGRILLEAARQRKTSR
jgi:hypothetical protein